MKSKIVLAMILHVCVLSNAIAYQNAHEQIYSIDDKEFLYDGDKYPNRKNVITREELQHDVAVLLAVFERVYSGRDNLPQGAYDKLVSDVQALGEKISLGADSVDVDAFCVNLVDIFWVVPDNHLKIWGGCNNKIKRPVGLDVGKNFYTGKGYHFEIRAIGEKRIGLLSLGSFMPGKNDMYWKGFEEKIANISKETDALIIDLRGNHGGMSDNIRWLANHLYGNPAKMVDEMIIFRKSAALLALMHNEPALSIIGEREKGLLVQRYLVRQKNYFSEGFKKLYKKPSKQVRLVRRGSNASFNPKRGYDKPVSILIDGGCASACESGFARFLSHPRIKTYGVNTTGAYHYGDNKPLVLPKSNIKISIPTSFREFADGRFIEKIGYSPDILVPGGQDALGVAMKDMAEK